MRNMLVAIVGAVASGWLFVTFGYDDASGFHIFSLVAAMAGAVLLLLYTHTSNEGIDD